MLHFSEPDALPYRYHLYGHVLAAAQPLPGLADQVASPALKPDVRIHIGALPVPGSLALDGQIAYAITPQAVYLAYPQVGRFVIECDGLGVVPDASTPPHVWQRWLLGPMLGLCLQRRGRTVLHANAVAMANQALLFLGDSGQGKTTLTRALLGRDAHLVTDDVAVLDVPPDAASLITITPGPPWLKLTDATWAAFHSAPFVPTLDGKAGVRIDSGRHAATALPVAALFVLSSGNEVACTSLSPMEAMFALQRHAHMPRALSALGTAPRHFLQSGHLAQRLPCFALQRSQSLADLPRLVDAVLDVAEWL